MTKQNHPTIKVGAITAYYKRLWEIKMDVKRIFEITKEIAESVFIKEQSRISPKYFTRNRNMTFTEAVYYILAPGKESLQLGLNRFFKRIGKEAKTISEQAFSKARSHFDHLPFLEMVRKSTSEQYSTQNGRQFLGKFLFAIDGTTLALPDKASLCRAFGASGRKKDSATAKVSLLYDIENDWIADAGIDTYKTTEHTLALKHIDRICALGIAEKSLIIFDRGYPQRALIQKLIACNISFLMRHRKSFNYTINECTQPDFVFNYDKNISLRVIKLTLATGETETLITNCFDLLYEDFQALYFKRWGVETKYDIIKNKFELGNFTGYTPNAILQDFWACIHLANIVATMKCAADISVQKSRKNTNNKYFYQVNTAQLVGSLKDYFIEIVFLNARKKRNAALKKLMLEITRALSPIRNERSFWRNPWPRKTKFHANSKSNI